MNDLNTVCMCMCVRWVMACVCGHVNTICAVCTGCELTDPRIRAARRTQALVQ